MQSDIRRGNKTGLVRPALNQLAARERFVQPRHRVMTEPRMQHQIGTARNDVNGVDLQQTHPFNRVDDIGSARAPTHRLQQSLCVQVQQTRLRRRYRRPLG